MRPPLLPLLLAMLVAASAPAATAAVTYPEVQPGATLEFPGDEGAHPAYRTEWWYVTGWLTTASGTPLGFQVTFFRSRPSLDDRNPSAFAAHQVVIAHAAISDPRIGRALHGERIARDAFGLASAATGKTDVRLGTWQLVATDNAFRAVVEAEDFTLELALGRARAALPNGRGGYSQKGPAASSASWYYSIPGLTVTGRVAVRGRSETVTGAAWLDHEWSSAYLDADSSGWDWVGLNLADGGSLMAFRIRDSAGATHFAGGTSRTRDGEVRVLGRDEVDFRPARVWRSPRTGIRWPVEVQVRAGALAFRLQPLLDDQESDSRLTTGAVYWEGAVRALGAAGPVGQGYLELTGYGERLQLR